MPLAPLQRGTGPPLAARNRIIIQPQDFVQMVAVEAEFDDANDVRAAGAAAGFATDTAISGNRGAPARRRLEKADAWVSGSDRTGGLEEDGRGRRMRAGHWDQFEANERLFQVQSSFDENQYTTPLNIGSYTRQERERAARLAREIERKARGMKDNLTEEERFSSVARSRNTNNSRVTGTNNNNPARPQRPIRTHSDGSTGGSTYVPPHRRAEGEASPVATRTKPADGERGSEAPVAAVRGQRVNNVELNEATRRRQTEELRDFAVSSRRGRTASDAGTPEEASAGPEEVGSGGDAAAETPAAAPAPAPETPAAAAPATGSAPAPAATATATATTTSGAAAPAPAPAPLKSKLRAESSVFVPRSRQMPPQSMAMMGGPGMPAMSVMVQPGQPRMMQGPVFQMGPRGYMVPSMPPAMAMGRPVMGMQFPPQQRYMMGAPAWNGPPQMMGGPGMGGPPRGPGPAVAVAYGGGAAVPMRGPPGPHGMQASNQMLPGSPRTHARRVKGGKDGGKGNRGGPRGAPRGPPHGAGPAAAPRGQVRLYPHSHHAPRTCRSWGSAGAGASLMHHP